MSTSANGETVGRTWCAVSGSGSTSSMAVLSGIAGLIVAPAGPRGSLAPRGTVSGPPRMVVFLLGAVPVAFGGTWPVLLAGLAVPVVGPASALVVAALPGTGRPATVAVGVTVE